MKKFGFLLILVVGLTFAVSLASAKQKLIIWNTLDKKIVNILPDEGFVQIPALYSICIDKATQKDLSNPEGTWVKAYIIGYYPKDLKGKTPLTEDQELEVLFRSTIGGVVQNWREGIYDKCNIVGSQFACSFPAVLDWWEGDGFYNNPNLGNKPQRVELMVIKKKEDKSYSTTAIEGKVLDDETIDEIMADPHSPAMMIGDWNGDDKLDPLCTFTIQTKLPN